MSDSLVVCQQVSKVFKDFWRRDRARAVNSLTFEIRPKEVFGLLGPNGSGKSTTIKMILGLLTPSAGRIALFGKSPTDVSVKRRIGYLPEESYMYGFLNARETLEYYAKLFEIDYRTRERRMDELLDMLGLTNAQFRPVREFSKGMQRRIGIAQALINDPDLLILDEPTTGLDPLGTRQIKDLIIELGRRGKTILLSSHLLADVEDCVDRLVILYGGQKRAEGTCDELLTSQSRTMIETDTLDDETVAQIDALIRARSNGERALMRVSKPRQSLEALFIDIVEKARSEIATSGATAGGETAPFLRASQADLREGEALITSLVAAGNEPPQKMKESVAVPAPVQGPDVSLIGNLTSEASGQGGEREAQEKQAAVRAQESQRAAVQRAAEIDTSVIGDLLGKPQGGEGAAGRERK
jgi:ABC-2 type transport system ATP-binding protein